MKLYGIQLPQIKQLFNPELLSCPVSKFNEDEEDLHRIYQYIKIKLQYKITLFSKRDLQFLEMEEEFLDIYEQIKKEKDIKKTPRNLTEGPFYSHGITGKRHKKIFGRLKYKVRTTTYRKNN